MYVEERTLNRHALVAADAARFGAPWASPEALSHRSPLTALVISAVEALAQGIALVDDRGDLAFINQSALRFLLDAGFSITRSVVRHPNRNISEIWSRAIAITRRHDRRQLHELIHSNESRFIASIPLTAIDHRKWILLTFGREQPCGELDLQMISARYGLSYMESVVLRKLARGERPAQIAQAHNVALSTVRTQIAALRTKTASQSIGELVSRLACLPALSPYPLAPHTKRS